MTNATATARGAAMARLRRSATIVFAASLMAVLLPATPAQAAVGFGLSTLEGADGFGYPPTTLQWGPDGRLYVGYFDGTIRAYTVVRDGENDYRVTTTQTINAVSNIPNHNDSGALDASENTRLLLGIAVTGTAQNPVIYATSSDPRIEGGGPDGGDLDLDTNSGTLSRLTWNGSLWNHVVLVRGLPRSEENHGPNGIALDESTNTLYWAYGGNTNKGGPSFNFAGLPEYAYSAAVLSVDLDAIGSTTYDLPTLDDPSRPNSGGQDVNDPFGGNDGANQAKITTGSPVQIHASGFRNPYDVLIATVGNHAGKMYVPDNGPNQGWGDTPVGEGGSSCTNQLVAQAQSGSNDALHLVPPGYYGGHPNPTRANMNNLFNGQSPVQTNHPVECDYRESKTFGQSGTETTAISLLPNSSNGIAEYTTDNFDGAMLGDLVLAGYQPRKIVRISLNSSGNAVTLRDDNLGTLSSSQGDPRPLDVTTMGENEAFPGTIWIAAFKQQPGDASADLIKVMEPNDFSGSDPPCTGEDTTALDDDGDGYSNADEIDNGTNPCSAASSPPDNDADGLSDLNDPNDDNDALNDVNDAFAIDPDNGLSTDLPVVVSWENNEPTGGIANTRFTGLMTNGTTNYLNQFTENGMTVGGAAGVFTVGEVPAGDAYKLKNSQMYGFQLGVDAPSTPFQVMGRMVAPFSGVTPGASQSMGIFLGDGTQANYVKIVLKGTNDTVEDINFLREIANDAGPSRNKDITLPGPDFVDLRLVVDPDDGTVQGFAQASVGGVMQPEITMGAPVSIPAGWLNSSTQGLAAGLISTSAGKAPPFPATWDFLHVEDVDGGEPVCGEDSPSLDDDADGYSNADEIDNGTDPCSAASTPPDHDGDDVSDLNDPDDDNDGVNDVNDAFAIDPANGLSTALPFNVSWEDGEPSDGIAGTRFTGLMTNGTTNYLAQFNESNLVVGGGTGTLTVQQVPAGDANGAKNSQMYGFQLGVDTPSTPFQVVGRMDEPFAGITPAASQSMGIFLGDGSQDNYVKIVLKGTNDTVEDVNFVREVAGATSPTRNRDITLPGPEFVDLKLVVNPGGGTVQAFAQASVGGVMQPEIMLGAPVSIPAGWLDSPTKGLAVGIISTSVGSAPPFDAVWDSLRVEPIP